VIQSQEIDLVNALKEIKGEFCENELAYLAATSKVEIHPDLARALPSALDPEVIAVEVVDDGYVEFEFIGEKQYLKERAFSRGANCTSVDAFMIGRLTNGERRAFLIEWKYAETYSRQDKYIPRREQIYDSLILAADSPFRAIEPRILYFEPFYQLMRQTLLAQLICQHSDHGCTSYRHVHVVPEENMEFHRNVTSPGLKGASVSEAWLSVLKQPDLFVATTPTKFMRPVVEGRDTRALTSYLSRRYWAGI